MGNGLGVVSTGHVGGTRGSGIVPSAADVLWTSVVDICFLPCICLWLISQIQTCYVWLSTWICLDIARFY